MTLRVALVGGPMYDHLYRALEGWDIEVVIHDDHPTLNQRAQQMLSDGERIDVLATHSKYAPSQAAWLRPLDDLVGSSTIDGLAERAVGLCRYRGELLSVPRLIDVRVLWAHRERLDERSRSLADTWSGLIDSGLTVGFPGRESGLFGTFFELVVGNGGTLFDAIGRPCLASRHAVQAVDVLAALAQRAPADLPDWHYDDVDRALLTGQVDVAGAWPGGWNAIRQAGLTDVLVPLPYPAGAQRRVSYAGCHSWAIPSTCGDLPGAVALAEALCSASWQAIDAAGGTMCANVAALAGVEPIDAVDAERLRITTATIADAMITYPPHERFPQLEEAGWRLIRDVLVGRRHAESVVEEMQRVAESVFIDG